MTCMKNKTVKGFTLLELLITIAIAGILIGIGVPSFGSMMAESRISAQYNALVGSLYHARSEAIKGAADVTVCPKNAIDSNACGGPNDWENGWIVFIDSNNVPNEAVAVIENAATDIISVAPAIKGLNTFRSFGSPTNTLQNVGDVSYVRYLQNGSSSLSTGSIVICDSRGSASSRSLNVVQTGDIRKGTVTPGSDAPRDVFNRAISDFCPEPN